MKVELGKGLGVDGRCLESLRNNGYKGVFLGMGLPQAKRAQMFQGLTIEQGFYTSKDYLPKVSLASKAGRLFFIMLNYSFMICNIQMS